MANPPTPTVPPERIGPYRLLDQLGEGGIGEVWLAEQTEPVRRRVALKLIKPGMDTRQVLARLEAERQALAVMEHPNIASFFDGGATEAGRPYFVMELVQGVPITDYCDTHRLSTDERLRLFQDVCHAVQHAHQKGVIHRDLKPSNVLVTVKENEPVVKVIDFGIAKALGHDLTQRTLVTRVGQIVGTPEYMSPEQAEHSGLDVDTRTDIYSLGVLLYEIVVGALPLDLAATPEFAIRHAIRETEVERPSTKLTSLGETQQTIARHRRTTVDSLKKELRTDLDWIILKAMEKDRTRRYETASELAQELQRHLDHEPVRAHAPGAGYRVKKFVRRHRAGVAVAAAIVGILVAAAAGMSVQAARIAQERDRAEREAETARQVSNFLVDLFEVSDPGEARGNEITARELLARGAERIRSSLADQPRTKARLLGTLAEVHYSLGLTAPALELASEAAEIREAELGPDHPETAEALITLGKAHWRRGQLDEARPLLERATAVLSAAGAGEESRLAEGTYLLGVLAETERHTEEAEASFLRALALWEHSGEPDSAAMAAAHNGLGVLYSNEAHYGEARKHLQRSIALKRRHQGSNHPALISSMMNLGVVEYQDGDLEGADSLFRQVLALTEKVHGPNHPDIADVLLNLGNVMKERGAPPGEIEPLWLRAVATWEKALGPESPDVGYGLTNLGNLYRDTDRFEEAERAYMRTDDVWRASLGTNHPLVGANMAAFAALRWREGRTAEADSLFQAAIAVLEESLPAEHPYLREPVQAYAEMLRELGRESEAERVAARFNGAGT